MVHTRPSGSLDLRAASTSWPKGARPHLLRRHGPMLALGIRRRDLPIPATTSTPCAPPWPRFLALCREPGLGCRTGQGCFCVAGRAAMVLGLGYLGAAECEIQRLERVGSVDRRECRCGWVTALRVAALRREGAALARRGRSWSLPLEDRVLVVTGVLANQPDTAPACPAVRHLRVSCRPHHRPRWSVACAQAAATLPRRHRAHRRRHARAHPRPQRR